MKKVLFLCTGNYYRSRFAEILFNQLARDAGLAWKADSCGLFVQADGIVNTGPLSVWTREACAARDLPLEKPERMPRQVSEDDLRRANLVIAIKEAEHRAMMREKHPAWENRITYWHAHDLDVLPAGEGLAEVEANVRQLLEKLKRNEPSAG